MREKIETEALRIGFTHVGFARAEALPDAPLMNWLSSGYHGTMTYMARDPQARLDPRKILDGCRTVISLAMNYYTPFPTKTSDDHGRVSRYARGRDYHKVIRKKLKALVRFIDEIAPNARTKICTDSTPISEKAWAERAGIGWRGKNTNLITRDYGSWVFLAEVLTDLDLEPDAPHLDFCGSCNRCVEACPTQAFPEPYVLDATKCIAYLTIESKERSEDSALAAQTGDWIFGCDICQEVCPWNKFSQPTQLEDFYPRMEHKKPLAEWLSLTDEEFLKQFAGTPLMRAKRSHMAENAAVAITNRKRENQNETARKTHAQLRRITTQQEVLLGTNSTGIHSPHNCGLLGTH